MWPSLNVASNNVHTYHDKSAQFSLTLCTGPKFIPWLLIEIMQYSAPGKSNLPQPAKSAIFGKIAKNSRKYRQEINLVPV